MPANVFELPVEHADARGDPPPVDLQFCFAGPARADTAPQTREIRARADKVRLTITQLSELHLHLAFAAASVPCKNVEDEHRSIDDWKRDDLFEILALTRAQLVEHEHEVRAASARGVRNLARFTTSNQRGGIDGGAPLNDTVQNLRARCLRERFELEQLGLDGPARILRVDGDEQRARFGQPAL